MALNVFPILGPISRITPARFDNRADIISLASTLAGDQPSLSFAKALDVVFDKLVKPSIIQPTFINHPPKEISPLAKASRDNPDEAERFDRLAILSRGRLTAVGTPAEVKRSFGDDLSLEDIFVQLQQSES